MKEINREFIEQIFAAKSVDQALAPLFEGYGPCQRSEYSLDKESLVDLDWELLGLVVTLSQTKLSQIYLSVHDETGASYLGWLGDGISSQISEDEMAVIGDINYKNFTVLYHFSVDKRLEHVVISKK